MDGRGGEEGGNCVFGGRGQDVWVEEWGEVYCEWFWFHARFLEGCSPDSLHVEARRICPSRFIWVDALEDQISRHAAILKYSADVPPRSTALHGSPNFMTGPSRILAM